LEIERIRPEAFLVMALARGDLSIPDQPLDWNAFLQTAVRHEVAGLCSWFLQQHPGAKARFVMDGVTASVGRALREILVRETAENLLYFREAQELSQALAAREVECLFFKGAWLASCAYPALGTRPIRDIDLGIREAQYHEAVEAIRSLGYHEELALPPDPRAALRRAHYGRQIRFSAPGRRPLELHFRMQNVGPPPADEEWIWRTARDAPVQGTHLRVPGPEAMLQHLLIHANQHGFAKLRLLHDVRWALQSDGASIRIERVIQEIQRFRLCASAYHGLLLAGELAGACVPDEWLDGLRPSRLRRSLFSGAWRLSEVRRLEVHPRLPRFESPRLYLLEMGGVRDKLRYVTTILAERGLRNSAWSVG